MNNPSQAITLRRKKQQNSLIVLAERRAGEMLKEVPRLQGARLDLTSHQDEGKLITYEETLKQNELSEITAHRWQLEADIPEERLVKA